MSYVETTKILMAAAARTIESSATTPVRLKSSGPCTARTRHPHSPCTPGGTASASHTTDNSAGVRVTEEKGPWVAQAGTRSPAFSRQIVYEPDMTPRLKVCWMGVERIIQLCRVVWRLSLPLAFPPQEQWENGRRTNDARRDIPGVRGVTRPHKLHDFGACHHGRRVRR